MVQPRDDFIISIRSALLKRGARQKFSLLFLICFSFLIFILDSYSLKFMNTTRTVLNDAVYRASSMASTPLRIVNFLSSKTNEHFTLYGKYKKMEKTLSELEIKNLDVKFLQLENNKFKKIIGSNEESNSVNVLATVIVDKDSPFVKSVIINKGSNSNILKGMPVLHRNYLIGRIVEVNYLSSRVLLLNDLNSRIPVIIEPEGYQAILSGKGSRQPFLAYLPEVYAKETGSDIYTSGKDGIFPSGIPIGSTILDGEFYSVKLSADPTQLSVVSVIVKKSKFKREDAE